LPATPHSAPNTLTTGASGISNASSISKLSDVSETQSPSPAVTVYSVPAVNPLMFPTASTEGPLGVKEYVRASSKLSIEALPATPHSAPNTLTTGASGISSASSISKLSEDSSTQSPPSPAIIYSPVPVAQPLLSPTSSIAPPVAPKS